MLGIFLIAFLSGCSSSLKIADQHAIQPDYTLVYMIHGDANYTYHENGKRFKADQEIVAEAKSVARKAKHGEVFIFHQKKERKKLLFFPQKDRIWYHYRGGVLVDKGKYSPEAGGFGREAELYQAEAVAHSDRKIFMYFGHEIPSKTSLIYHRSLPKKPFNTEIFAKDLTKFEPHFDLLLLSTCNNGNPWMAESVADKVNYMIASPRNLHLSYMETQGLSLLEEAPNVSTKQLADTLALQSFERLSGQLQTMVTIGVYDLHEIGKYIHDYSNGYVAYLNKLRQKSLFTDNTDCNSMEVFKNQPIPQNGAHLYFKPPAFGRDSNLKNHSVWGCKQ